MLYRSGKILAVLLFVCLGGRAPADCVINEIMYHPDSLIEGEEFIELYNGGVEAVDLSGWCLDGVGFCFGSGISLPPGAYVVLARDAAAFTVRYGFEPDFVYPGQLDNGGESLTLRDALDQIVDRVVYLDEPPWPVLPDGLGPSLERIDPTLAGDTPRNWRAATAEAGHTAKAANSVVASGLPPWLSDVSFQLSPLPNTPLLVTARAEDASQVQLTYVIDFGDAVTVEMTDAGNGIYGAEIPGQAANALVRFNITATGPTGTMRYPRIDDTITYDGTKVADPAVTTALPVVEWFVHPDDYAQALSHYLTNELEPAVLCYNGKLYDNIQFRVRGQMSRYWPKKNWKIHFPQGHDFQDAARLALPLDQFDLQSNYSDKAWVREILAYEMLHAVSAPSCPAFHVRLHQNGAFYGLYTLRMGIDDDYLDYNGLDADGAWYKAYSDCRYLPLESLPPAYQKKTREYEGYDDLHELLYNVYNLTGQARHDFLFNNVDLAGMANYLAAMSIIHNNDHVAKNYLLYRDTMGTQRWTMHAWDLDLVFGRNYGAGGGVLSDGIWADNDDIGLEYRSPSHPLFGDYYHRKYDNLWNRAIGALFADLEFRAMYYRRLRTLMDAVLSNGYFEQRITELTGPIGPEAVLDVGRWGQYGEAQTLSQAVDLILNDYLPRRRTHLFVTHQVPGEIPPAQSATPLLCISEIMYNPATGSAQSFVELYNPSADEAVDLSGWQLIGLEFRFPPGTVLLPQHYGVVVKDDPAFRAAYIGGHHVLGVFPGALAVGGETLELRTATGLLIDAVRYDDEPPWPTAPDGTGPSLELIDLARDNMRVTNWAASVTPGGTPGASNSTAGTLPELPPLWINEVLPRNEGVNQDGAGDYDPWIEIFNGSAVDVDLGGMYLTADLAIPAKWAFPPNTTIAALSWLIVWSDNEPAEGPLHTNFRLAESAGVAGLFTPEQALIDYVTYESLGLDVSYGMYPDGFPEYATLDVATPLAANVLTPGAALILNEYNAVDADRLLKNSGSDTYWGRVLGNGGDWFELVVTKDHVDARGWQLVISNDTGGSGHTVETLTLADHQLWADLRSGTIITVSENLADEVSFDPVVGDWWINVQAADGAAGTYITPESFKVSNNNWQLTIRDALGSIVFGPAGEGIAPPSGIGGDEVFRLAADPSSTTMATSLAYEDAYLSTFGAPNIYDDGVSGQDFEVLRELAAPCHSSADCDDGNPCTSDTCEGFAGCSYSNDPDGTSCDDGLFCNGNESCQDGTCTGGTPPCVDQAHCDELADTCLPCIVNAECDDFNPCTMDECADDVCVFTPVADGTACDDGAFCTLVDSCQSGTCVGTGDPCGDACTQCDELTRSCVRCVFDLYAGDDGAIGGGDFGIFAGYFGNCYEPGDPALVADFDGDGCVGGADFGLFAGCFAQTCAECANCFGVLEE